VTNLNDADLGSLRQAILDTPAGGTVDFQPGLTGTITLTSGELAISKDLTIAGPGADVLAVSGNHASRVFDIAATFIASLAGLTISDGRVSGTERGGGISNGGTLTVTGCTLSFNGTPGFGGGIYNFGTGLLTVTGSTFTGNAAFSGGGIRNEGTLTVTDSTFGGNQATGPGARGGGIDNVASGTLTVTGSTLSGNYVSVGGGCHGGGICNEGTGTVTVTGSTLSGNTADGSSGGGGGICNEGTGTVTVTGSTLSGNTASGFGAGTGNGGGILCLAQGATLTVTDSTLSGNSATGGSGGTGGGISIAAGATLTVTDSTLSGNTARGAGSGIYNAGTLAVRGTVTIDGDYFQTATGTLDLRVGGTQAGTDYGQLVVHGLATLDGTLAVNLVNGFVPQPGDQWQPLLFGSGSGTFAHYTGDVGGFSFLYVYDDGSFLPPGLTLVAN
jgi:hypothetical protein